MTRQTIAEQADLCLLPAQVCAQKDFEIIFMKGKYVHCCLDVRGRLLLDVGAVALGICIAGVGLPQEAMSPASLHLVHHLYPTSALRLVLHAMGRCLQTCCLEDHELQKWNVTATIIYPCTKP